MNSRENNTDNNLAPKMDASDLFSLLRELANLTDDMAAFERFARRWPGIIDVSDDYEHDSFVGYSFGEPKEKMPRNLPRRFLLVWQWREALREVWGGNSEKLTDVLLPSFDEIMADPDPDFLWPPQLKVDWHRGEFVYIPRSKLQEAIYALLRRSALVKICANPDCPAPYFIAGKTAQRYCSDGCAQVFQREWKRRWWKEKGTKWRSKKSRGKRGKR